MTRIDLEIYDDVISTIIKLKEINDSGIELVIPEGSILFENILNFKLISREAEKYGSVVHFSTTDENGANLLAMLEQGPEGSQVMASVDAEQEIRNTIAQPSQKYIRKFSFVMPAIIKNIKLPKSQAIWGVLVAVLLISLLIWDKNRQTAYAKINVKAQPLTRSITIKAKDATATNPDTKTLNATTIKTTVEQSAEGTATGEKFVGDKAEGKANIFNKTSSDKEFKKGTVLVYDKDSGDLKFVTTNEVTVPAATEQTPGDPASPLVPSSVEVEIEAEQIGPDYNLDKGTDLEVEGYKKADFAAEISEDTSGGKSTKVKIITEDDIKKAVDALTIKIGNQAPQDLNTKISNSQQLVTGSTKLTTIKQTVDHKAGDEVDKFNVTQTVEIAGLTYMKNELDRLLDSLVKDVVPQGFVLSSKEREVSVEALGNTNTSVLSSTEADLQVTLKTFVVPDISEDAIKKDLAGKSKADAKNYLESIQNIDSVEFSLSKPLFWFFNNVPKNLAKIKVEVVRE